MNVPYIGLAFSGLTLSPSFGFNVYALYSPVAHCEDRDDHIMRSKLSTGETDGTFFSVGGNVRWQLTTHLSVTSSLNYTLYDLEGEQDQAFYGTDTFGTGSSGIDLDIEGDQVYFGFTVGYDL
jgi:outer membrane protease